MLTEGALCVFWYSLMVVGGGGGGDQLMIVFSMRQAFNG